MERYKVANFAMANIVNSASFHKGKFRTKV